MISCLVISHTSQINIFFCNCHAKLSYDFRTSRLSDFFGLRTPDFLTIFTPMNFLSHYYFERENQNENEVIGTVLPDLVKNAHKDWNLYPQKREEIFATDLRLVSILKGWKKHLEVDILFHSSDFFNHHTSNLKQLLLPILKDSPVRPSFLAHIGIELLLDHLLVVHEKIDINSF